MFGLKFEFEDLQATSEEYYQWSGVVFEYDFGPWKGGQKLYCLSYEFESSTLTEYDETNKIVHRIQTELRPCT